MPEAKKEWERLAELMNQMGVLTEVDMAAFAAYCQSYARWKEARFIRLGKYVKSMLIVPVTESFGFLKRGTYYTFHFIEKSSAECISE